jgi:endoglucanase
MTFRLTLLGFLLPVAFIVTPDLSAQSIGLHLRKKEYFETPGINVMAFQDIDPDGHQGGVSIIQNGVRVATNGDIHLDPAPGQWQSMPKQDARTVDAASDTITTTLSYSDPAKNRTGFNPIDYPDLNFTYKVRVHGEGGSIRITVDLDKPIPTAFIGKVGFNFELFPNDLFGKSWYLGNASGIFPHQPNGPETRDFCGHYSSSAESVQSRGLVLPRRSRS